MDVTYEQMQQESRERYESLVHCLPDGVIVYSEFRIVFANAAALKILGATSRHELEGKWLFDLIHPDDQIERGIPSTPVFRKLNRFDGATISAEVHAIPIQYDGKCAVQLILRDISPMIRMEETLNEKKDMYKTLVENVVAGVFVAQENEIVYVNPYLVNMFGYTFEELQKLPVDAVVDHNELVMLDYDDCKQSMNGQEQHAFKIKGKRKDGSSIYLEGNCSLISFNGKEAILGTVQDVTFKHEQDQLLQNNAKLYQRMLMSIPEPIFISHEDEVLYANQYAIDLVGQSDDSQIIGKPYYRFIHEHDREHIKEDMRRAMLLDEPSSKRSLCFIRIVYWKSRCPIPESIIIWEKALF